jgi:N-acetylglucosamine-6-phosphate deacetylase
VSHAIPSNPIGGFCDLQVNGYAGLDFNNDLYSQSELIQTCERLRRDGVEKILATIITAPLALMEDRIRYLAKLIEGDPTIGEMIAGIHIEGPFISPEPGYVGAHPTNEVLPASLEHAVRLIDAGAGHVRLMTLAPEVDNDCRLIRWLTNQGIVVAAGHSNASHPCLRRAIDAGLKLYTHLGNGCPPALPRHDNIIQRVLSLSDHLSVSFIADGHHIPAFVLKNYLKLMPPENVIIVTDAISAAGLGSGTYKLGNQLVEVDEHGAAWSADRTHFAGSAATMPEMISVLESIEIPPERIAQWTITNPWGLVHSLVSRL